MAQLKDTIIQGSARITDALYTNTVQLYKLFAPTTEGGANCGPGANGQVLTSNGTTSYWASLGSSASYDVTDATAARAIVNTSTMLLTERAIYYGLPTINNAHNYTSSTTIYAPTTGGTANYILWANNATSAPSWKAPKDALNYMINALDTGSSVLTANDYIITQYVGGGTTTTTYHRRPASAVRVGGLLTARNLGVALGSTTAVTFDGTTDQTSIPVSGTLGIANGGTGSTSAGQAYSTLAEGNYISCSTAADTAAKVGTYAGFVLKSGATISIVFTAQNTAATPTLNINSTGAKNIFCRGVQVKSYGLMANYCYNMVYDGTQWQILNPPTGLKADCTTAVGTAAKTANVPGFVLYAGAEVYIRFTKNNTALTPTLNINGLGAKSIRNKDVTTGSLYYVFRTNQYYLFVYDGTAFNVTNNVIQQQVIPGVTAVAEVVDPDTGTVTTPAVAQVHGTDTLYLGNITTSTTNGGLTGILGLYNAGTKLIEISAELNTAGSSRKWYLPNLNSNRYFVTHSAATALGSATKPIFLNANGAVAECTYSLNATINAGTITRMAYYSGANAISSGTIETDGTYLKLDKKIYLGSFSQTVAPNASGINIPDNRSVAHLPNTFGNQVVQWYFDDGIADTGRNGWSTIMHMKGWSDTNYAAHQISFNAHSDSTDGNLYHRTGSSNTWKTHNVFNADPSAAVTTTTWRKVLDNVNINEDTDSPFVLTTINKSIIINQTWKDTGISGTNIPVNGSYIVQVFINTSTANTFTQATEYYTGFMSWYSGTCQNADDANGADEIILHRAGANSIGKNIYLRTIRVANGLMKLQIKGSMDSTVATSIYFRFRRVI